MGFEQPFGVEQFESARLATIGFDPICEEDVSLGSERGEGVGITVVAVEVPGLAAERIAKYFAKAAPGLAFVRGDCAVQNFAPAVGVGIAQAGVGKEKNSPIFEPKQGRRGVG